MQLGKVARCTLARRSGTAGRYCQTSSQVKLMIGASKRTSFSDAPDRSLRRPPPARIGSGGVQTVLENVEVERAQVHHAEIVNAMVDLVKSEFVVPANHIRRHGRSLTQHVLIDALHLIEWNGVALGRQNRGDCSVCSETGCCGSCDSFPRRAASIARSRRRPRENRPTPPTDARSRRPGGPRCRPGRRHCREIWTWPVPSRRASSPGLQPRGKAGCHACPWHTAGKTETIRDIDRRLPDTDRMATDSWAHRRTKQDSWCLIPATRQRCQSRARRQFRCNPGIWCWREESYPLRACTRNRRPSARIVRQPCD